MATRPLIAVINPADGTLTSKKIKLPGVFTAPIRLDIVNFVHTNLNKNRRQAHGVDPRQGHKHSAESWGTGRAVARLPRVSGSGTHRSGQAAFGNQCRKGRMFAPLHTWRRWHRTVNTKQKRHAVAAAVAATGIVPLVQARGHRIWGIPELPLVVDDTFEKITKTKQAVAVLKKLGAYDDVRRVIVGKKIRAGKGKLRNRRYQRKKGPLVVFGSDSPAAQKALRNIPGVDTLNVNRLNLLQLAPGGQLGRFTLWTASAFEALNRVFGTYRYTGQQKLGYQLHRPVLTNPDIARIINSNEVQSVVVAAKANERFVARKKNALTNHKFQEHLNPYAAIQRKRAQDAQEAGKKRREEQLSKNRKKLTKDAKKSISNRKKLSRKWIVELRAAEQEANKRGIAEELDFKQTTQ